jgi:hypothetical protein
MERVLAGLPEMDWNVFSRSVPMTTAPLTDLLDAAVQNGLMRPAALTMLACSSPGSLR